MKNPNKPKTQGRNHASSIIIFSILLFICTGCPPPPNCAKGELNFEPPTFVAGTVYSTAGPLFNNGRGLYAGLMEFTHASGSTELKYASIDSIPPHPFGAGQVLRLSIAALNFDLTAATKSVKFEYLYQGGIINIGAKGNTNVYIGPLRAMPSPLTINGVTIWKTNVQHIINPQGVWVAQTGVIHLKHSTDIGGLIIGGAELFVDNFCTN